MFTKGGHTEKTARQQDLDSERSDINPLSGTVENSAPTMFPARHSFARINYPLTLFVAGQLLSG